jgi:GTP-sensing pleiotropic transcriptional regulator CodY
MLTLCNLCLVPKRIISVYSIRQKYQLERKEKLIELKQFIVSQKKGLTPQEELDLRLKLKELSLLIEEEKFQEFDRKWKMLWLKIKKRGG